MQVLLPVRNRGGSCVGAVDECVELVELVSQRHDALPHGCLADEVGGEEAHDALVQDARVRHGRTGPGAEGVDSLLGQRVVRALVRAPRLLACREVPELR